MDAEMTEKKLAQSLDDIIGSSGKGGGGRAAGKAAAPQQQGSGGKAKAGKPQHFARGATKVIPITIRTQGRNAGPRSKPSAQQHVPGLKGVRHVPATSPARLQKALGGGGAGRFKQTQQLNTAQLRTSKLQAHQAVGAAARQATIAQKRGMTPIQERLAPVKGNSARSPLSGRLAPIPQSAPKVGFAAGAKWKITITNNDFVKKPPPQSIIMPGQSNGAPKKAAARNAVGRDPYAHGPNVSQREHAGRGGRGGTGVEAGGGGGGLSDRFRQIRSGGSAGETAGANRRVIRNAAGVLMPC